MSADWWKLPFDPKNPPQRRPPDRGDLAAMHVELNRLWAVRADGRFGALQELFEAFEQTFWEWPHVRYTSLFMSLGETLHGALHDACTRNHGGIPRPGTGRVGMWPKDRIVFWNDLPPVLALAPREPPPATPRATCEACRERGPVPRHPPARKPQASDAKGHDDDQVSAILEGLREGRARRAALLAETEET